MKYQFEFYYNWFGRMILFMMVFRLFEADYMKSA